MQRRNLMWINAALAVVALVMFYKLPVLSWYGGTSLGDMFDFIGEVSRHRAELPAVAYSALACVVAAILSVAAGCYAKAGTAKTAKTLSVLATLGIVYQPLFTLVQSEGESLHGGFAALVLVTLAAIVLEILFLREHVAAAPRKHRRVRVAARGWWLVWLMEVPVLSVAAVERVKKAYNGSDPTMAGTFKLLGFGSVCTLGWFVMSFTNSGVEEMLCAGGAFVCYGLGLFRLLSGGMPYFSVPRKTLRVLAWASAAVFAGLYIYALALQQFSGIGAGLFVCLFPFRLAMLIVLETVYHNNPIFLDNTVPAPGADACDGNTGGEDGGTAPGADTVGEGGETVPSADAGGEGGTAAQGAGAGAAPNADAGGGTHKPGAGMAYRKR